MIDAHCHLHSSSNFPSNRPQILADFDETKRRRMLDLSQEHDDTFCVIGTHPWQASIEKAEDWMLKMDPEFVKKYAIVGIGEIGLDFFRAKTRIERESQTLLFKSQIEKASTLGLPVVLHCVRSHQEVLESLKGFEKGGIIHGFRSSYEVAKRYLDSGFTISLGDAINLKTSGKLRETVTNLGVDNVVVESDAHAIEDASLDKTLQTLAEIFKLDIESLEMKLDQNLASVFPKVKR